MKQSDSMKIESVCASLRMFFSKGLLCNICTLKYLFLLKFLFGGIFAGDVCCKYGNSACLCFPRLLVIDLLQRYQIAIVDPNY